MVRITRMTALAALAMLFCPGVLTAQYLSPKITFNGPTINDRTRDQEIFRVPEYSPQTSGYIVANPANEFSANAAWRDSGIAPATPGNIAALTVAFTWVDALDPAAWVRLNTFNGPIHPNPSLDTSGKVRFIFTSQIFNPPLGVCLGIRETGIVTGQMLNGGTTGEIEWFGVTTDLSVIDAGSNGVIDSTLGGDDIFVATNGFEAISWGPDRILQSTVGGDDVAKAGYFISSDGSRIPIPAITLEPFTSAGNLVEWDLNASTVRVSTTASPANFGAPIAVGTAAFTEGADGDLSNAPNNRGTLDHIVLANVASDSGAEQFVAIDDLQFEATVPDPATPPTILGPIAEDDTTVTVTNLMPAVNQVQLFRNSTVTAEKTVNVANNNDLVITLNSPAVAGDVFRAKQRSGDSGEVSDFSDAVTAVPLGQLLIETFDTYATQEDLLAVWNNSIAVPSDQLTLEAGDAVSCNNFVQEYNENSTTFQEARLYRGFGSANGSDEEPLRVTWRFLQTATNGNERTRFELARFDSGTWSASSGSEGTTGFSLTNAVSGYLDVYNVILRSDNPEFITTNGFVTDGNYRIASTGVTKTAGVWHKFDIVITTNYINYYLNDELVTPEAFTVAGGASTNGLPRPNADPYQYVVLGIGYSNNGPKMQWDDIAVTVGDQALPFGDPPPAAPQISGSILPNDTSINVTDVNTNATEVTVYENDVAVGSVTTTGFASTDIVVATSALTNGSIVTVRQVVGGVESCDSQPSAVGAIPGAPTVLHPLEASDVTVTVTGVDSSATLVTVYANTNGEIGSINPQGATTVEVPVDPLVHLDLISATASNPIGESPQSPQLEVGSGNGEILVSLGIRETSTTGPLGVNGGSSGSIEFIGAATKVGSAPQGKPVTPGPNWQTLTFDHSVDPIVPMTGDGSITATWGVLEQIAFAVPADSPSRSVGSYDVYIDNIRNGSEGTLNDFESQIPGTETMFRTPGFSGSTSAHLLTPPNTARTAGIGNPGNSAQIQFYFKDTTGGRWLRLTTFGATVLPNPAIRLDQPLSFDILLLEQSLPDPPSVRSPLEAGDTTVIVNDIAPDATLVDVLADGNVIASVDPMGTTNGLAVVVPPLEHLDIIAARQTAGGTSPASAGLEVGKGNGVVYVSVGIRETGDAGPLGSPGTTSGSIEWIGATGKSPGGAPLGLQLTPMNAWQTVTFNPADVVAFLGNGVIDGTRGTLEHLAVSVDSNSPDRSTGVYRMYVDNVINVGAGDGGADFLITDFEGFALDSEVLFQEPSFSGSTDFNVSFPPSASANTSLYNNGGERSQLLTWFFRDTSDSRWLRIVTATQSDVRNPIIDLTKPVQMDILLLAGCENPGDMDGDCDIDSDDLAMFVPCMAGPAAAASPECACADLTGNGRVDLRDFQLFQIAYTDGALLPGCTP